MTQSQTNLLGEEKIDQSTEFVRRQVRQGNDILFLLIKEQGSELARTGFEETFGDAEEKIFNLQTKVSD